MPKPTLIRISPNLTLPLDVVTETFGVLGRKGSGKSNTAAVLVEELLAAYQQVLVIDPTDSWWGLKSSRDGKSAGFAVSVLGGWHGDLPLSREDGKGIADFLVDTGASLVVSLRKFEEDAPKRRFVTDLCNRLYYRKGGQSPPTPMMVVIDEASVLVPQTIRANDEGSSKCVGAVQQLVRQGRTSGIGVGLIDQRPATVNKDVLSQVGILIIHRIVSTHDRAPIKAWVEQHDVDKRGEEFLSSLASLRPGVGWIWSTVEPEIFTKVQVNLRRTFDSGATPKPGQTLAPPKLAAKVDLHALQKQLASSLEKARADDPAELRKQIATLQREVASVKKEKPAAVVDEQSTQRAVTKAIAERDRHWRTEISKLSTAHEAMRRASRAVVKSVEALHAAAEQDKLFAEPPALPALPAPAASKRGSLAPPSIAQRPARSHVEADASVEGLSAPRTKMLLVLANFAALGQPVLKSHVLAVMSGQSPASSGWDKNVGALRRAGLVEYPSAGLVTLTTEGERAISNHARPPMSLDELHDSWVNVLNNPQGRMIRELTQVYPQSMTRAELGERTGQSTSSSGWDKNIGRLRTLGVVSYPDKDHVVATDLLFPEGLS